MFRQLVTHTEMMSNEANNYFVNIGGEKYNGDVTFISTLRALVAPRIGDDESLFVYFKNSSYTCNDVQCNPAKNVINAIYNPGYYSNGTIVVHSFNGRGEDNTACIKLIESHFCNVYTGWERLVKVTEFFQKTFYCSCFINQEMRKVVIFTELLNSKTMHYLQCAIFAFLPWYFDPEKGVNADEMELINSLREKTPAKYEEVIDRIAMKYDFRSMGIRRLLAGFDIAYERREIERIKNCIDDNLRHIAEMNSRIANAYKQKREYEVKLLGLETKIASTEDHDSEIMEYFLCNKKLTLGYVDDEEIAFHVNDYLSYFDEDMAKTMIDNNRSYIYYPDGRDYSDIISHEDIKKLMYAIFVDQTLKIRFCSAYRFELGVRVRGMSGYDYGKDFRSNMPNPHIDAYSCLGNYEIAINNCIQDNDYIGAIEQSIASCKSLNFGDSTVMKTFMRRIYGDNGYSYNRCIEIPDGRVLTPIEAVEWMKNEEHSASDEEIETDMELIEDELVEAE